MTKLIIQHLWSDFKKHWLGILVTLVLCYMSGRYEIKKKIFALLFLEQGFFLSDFICITLSELYRKSADIFPDSRAYIATFFVLLYPD